MYDRLLTQFQTLNFAQLELDQATSIELQVQNLKLIGEVDDF
jgi:hypothetical protein